MFAERMCCQGLFRLEREVTLRTDVLVDIQVNNIERVPNGRFIFVYATPICEIEVWVRGFHKQKFSDLAFVRIRFFRNFRYHLG